MGDKKWWLNRAGQFAPTSNPGSMVPNYGLTLDVATTPWDQPSDFAALAEAQKLAAQFMGGAGTLVHNVTRPADMTPDKTLWDRVTGAASSLGDVAKGAVGGIDTLADKFGADTTTGGQYDKLSKKADKLGLEGWDRLKFIGGQDLSKTGKNLAEDPMASKLFWALDKASEYGATAFVSATEAQKHGGMFFESDNWNRAHDQVKKYDLNAGEGFVQMFYDDEILDDEKRFEELRKHGTVFNFSALGFNTFMAWKFDPAVIGGQGIGAARALRRGTLDKTGSASTEIQRTILAQKTRADAEAIARQTTGVGNRLRAQRSLTLWDKAQNLRAAAQEMGYEEFKRLSPFTNSASGAVLSKLLQDVAHDDEAWNLVFRASIGDSTALEPLHAMHQGIGDKINALELNDLPTAQREFDAVASRYEARLREQGGKMSNDDRLVLHSARDWFLEDDFQAAKARLDEANAHLAGYKEYDSWLTRATEGTRAGQDTKVNTTFNALDQLQPAKAHREALADSLSDATYGLRQAATRTFRLDEYGRVARLISAPTKPMLKRTSMVDLSYAESGAQAISGRLNQIAYFAGKKDQSLRDHVMGRWAAATTDMERKQLAEELDRQGMDVVFRKHGINNPKVRKEIIDLISQKRGLAYARLSSDKSMYTRVKDSQGRFLDKRVYMDMEDDKGTVLKVAMPMDPTELPNYHPFVNLTDLDRAIAQNKTRIKELNDEANILERSGRFTQRWATDLATHVGESFNSFWKPWALVSFRWPSRVVADESMRVMLFLGVATHMQTAMQGTKNIFLNSGFVKPHEWIEGRKVTTGSISEDSLRTMPEPFDPFDPRAGKNPTAAVPFDVAELGSADQVRYDKMLEQVAEQRDWLRKGQMGSKPRWAQRFEDRMDLAEKVESRGFFFDPVNGKARNKGFAVSVYPGRLRTFEKKPSAADLHWWMERNADVLSIPSNQVAVWADKGTGRWHIDVVRHTKRREDAMQLAARAQADDFFDISDGFTRYMRDEDPYGHAAFAADENAPQVSDTEPHDVAGVEPKAPSTKRKVGVGTVRFKTADGRVVEGEDVYGSDVDNLNIFYSAHSAKGAAQQLYGSYTKSLGDARTKRNSRAATSIDPGDVDDLEGRKAWAHAQSAYVNRHFRKSPIWRQMLDGRTDAEIEKWLTSTPEGRALRNRMGKRALHPGHWVDDMRMIFDHTLPTVQARQAARAGDIAPEQWDDLIPHELRNDVHGDDIRLIEGSHEAQAMMRKTVNWLMEHLGSMPTDTLVRHPFAANLYNQRMRNYIRSLDVDEVTPEVMAAASSSARAYATKEINRLLYNMADEVEAMHMLRFVAPFIQAQVEVLERYATLFTRKPEALVRFAQLFYLSQQGNKDRGLWYTVDADGNPTSRFSHDNKVILQDNAFTRHLKKLMPGLEHAGDVRIPVGSLDLVFQGEKPWLPSMGPLVTYPAAEFYYKNRPFKSEGEVFKWLYPYGTPKGSNPVSRAFNATAPAYAKRLYTALTNDFSDSAYANFTNIRYQDLVFEWEQEHGKTLPARLQTRFIKEAESQTRAYWFLRAASSFVMPFPVEAGSPQQFWIDQARKYRNKYGLDADRKFYDDFGADYFKYFTESTRSTNGLAPTVAGAQGYLKNKRLVDLAPDLAGVIAGPGSGGGDFSYEVYNWQLRTRKGPGSKEMMRELQDPAERINQGQIAQGWIEYGKLASAVDAEMRARGLSSLNSAAAGDLRVFKAQKVAEIIQRNPAWQTAYRSRNDTLSNWLNQANAVAFDKGLDGRTDIEGLRAYLVSRDKVQALLQQRLASGGSASLSADSNADLGQAWNSYLTELTSKNLLFAEIYHRYLEGDDLTSVVNN